MPYHHHHYNYQFHHHHHHNPSSSSKDHHSPLLDIGLSNVLLFLSFFGYIIMLYTDMKSFMRRVFISARKWSLPTPMGNGCDVMLGVVVRCSKYYIKTPARLYLGENVIIYFHIYSNLEIFSIFIAQVWGDNASQGFCRYIFVLSGWLWLMRFIFAALIFLL
jgi:hypothetical protein